MQLNIFIRIGLRELFRNAKNVLCVWWWFNLSSKKQNRMVGVLEWQKREADVWNINYIISFHVVMKENCYITSIFKNSMKWFYEVLLIVHSFTYLLQNSTWKYRSLCGFLVWVAFFKVIILNTSKRKDSPMGSDRQSPS